MVNLFRSFSRIQPQKVMVIGDFMLDTYTLGKVNRISPEAPVAVLQVNEKQHRPGGAGNVALNLLSIGADVVTVGRVGSDEAGQTLIDFLKSEGVETSGIQQQKAYTTPVKNRIIADYQQIVRVDHEKVTSLPEQFEQQLIDQLPSLFDGIRVVAVSDYGKGGITKTLLEALFEIARENHVPVIVDPKGLDYSKYLGATIIKPNLTELYAAARLTPEFPIEQAAQEVLNITKSDILMVTRSQDGISLFYQGGKREDFPVRMREVNDVTGAGDTVLAMMACAVANGLNAAEGAQLSNLAAGIAIERFGCARVTLSEVARQLLQEDLDNKVFDEEHLYALQEALKGRRFAVLTLSSEKGLTPQLFTSIRELALKDNWDLLVYIRDLDPPAYFLDVLASLHDVDYIIVNSQSLEHLYRLISPETVYSFDENTLKKIDYDLV